ncbi:MAG: hypothetical protein LC792_23855 [Actinobacteria bacterium]|nr:hypothetical protein [Actinomycetota bacterium]
MTDPDATTEEPKKRRGKAALGSGWDWAKGQLSDSKVLAKIAGVVAVGIGMAGLAINEVDLRHRLGVIEAPKRLAPVVQWLDGLDSAVAALKKKDPQVRYRHDAAGSTFIALSFNGGT